MWPGSPVGDIGEPDRGAIGGLVLVTGGHTALALPILGNPEDEFVETFDEFCARERLGEDLE
jgi:hypothetical protein